MIRHYCPKHILYGLMVFISSTALKPDAIPKLAEPNEAQEWCPKMEFKEPTLGHYLRYINSAGTGSSITRLIVGKPKYNFGCLGDSVLNIASAYCEYNKVNNNLLGIANLARAGWLISYITDPNTNVYAHCYRYYYSVFQGSLSLVNAAYRLVVWDSSKK